MYNGKYVSLGYVVEGVNRSFGLEVAWMDAAEWVGEVMRLIGSHNVFKKYRKTLPIVSYKAEIPGDLLEIKHVRDCDSGVGLQRVSDETITGYADNEDSDTTKSGYDVNDNYIFTTFEEGTIELYYIGYPIDEDGIPLIPDNGKYIMAMQAYLAEREAFKRYIRGDMDEKRYEKINSERLFYVPAAMTSTSVPDLDQMEAIKNIIIRSIPRLNEHQSSYKYISTREERYNHDAG